MRNRWNEMKGMGGSMDKYPWEGAREGERGWGRREMEGVWKESYAVP